MAKQRGRKRKTTAAREHDIALAKMRPAPESARGHQAHGDRAAYLADSLRKLFNDKLNDPEWAIFRWLVQQYIFFRVDSQTTEKQTPYNPADVIGAPFPSELSAPSRDSSLRKTFREMFPNAGDDIARAKFSPFQSAIAPKKNILGSHPQCETVAKNKEYHREPVRLTTEQGAREQRACRWLLEILEKSQALMVWKLLKGTPARCAQVTKNPESLNAAKIWRAMIGLVLVHAPSEQHGKQRSVTVRNTPEHRVAALVLNSILKPYPKPFGGIVIFGAYLVARNESGAPVDKNALYLCSHEGCEAPAFCTHSHGNPRVFRRCDEHNTEDARDRDRKTKQRRRESLSK